MAKGLFTQGMCLLTDGGTTIEDIKAALHEHGFEILKQVPATEHECFAGPTLVVPFCPEANGYVAVDIVSQPWPDSMGDPKADPFTFGAWSMGNFGPFAFPGGMARARQHAWAWEPGRTVSENHRGFVRIRSSYIFGCKGNAPILPTEYDPLAELMFVSRVALAGLYAPGVICYFNPNGEVLRDRAAFHELWEGAHRQQTIPLPLWMNIRFFNLDDRLGFMDTVGNGQLEIQDLEAVFPLDKYAPADVDYYLRNVTHYLIDHEGEIKAGDAIDGPGDTGLSWTIGLPEDGIVPPPRRTWRLCPKAHTEGIRAALAAIGHTTA